MTKSILEVDSDDIIVTADENLPVIATWRMDGQIYVETIRAHPHRHDTIHFGLDDFVEVKEPAVA